MSLFKNNEDLLDEAVAQVADEPIDPREVDAAASRVWARLEAQAGTAPSAQAAAPAAPSVQGSLHGCEDYRSSIPAYLRGELSPARALLVEDHTRSCVPCRRALREAREGHLAVTARPAAKKSVLSDRRVWMPLAAMLMLALGFGLVTLVQEMMAGGSKMASIEAVDGALYRMGGDTSRRLNPGDTIDEGDEIRTAKGSTAMVRMADGSRIEMSERAGLSLDAGRKGNTIELERGRIIIQAAKQRPRHLYVATRDALVSVTGTIFAVNSGTKGARVSVIEGEVHVDQAEKDAVLHAGDQVTTHASVERVSVGEEVAWSRNAKQYQELLAELTALGKDIDARVERPGLRYSTRLLDLAPEGTTVYIALPNLTKSLVETERILGQRIEESPTIAQWWTETLGSTGNEQRFHDMIQRLGNVGKYLGEEVAIVMNAGADGSHDCVPVLMAEVTNEASFRSTLEAEIARLTGSGKRGLVFVDDLNAPPAGGDAVMLWIHDGLFVASPSLDGLRKAAAIAAGGNNPFTGSTFHQRIAQQYRDGAGWLFAADLHTLIAKGQASEPAESRQMAERMGILDLDHFIVDRREVDGKAETRAALTFDQPRRGVAAWLSAPAPMGGLAFFSPDANLAAAFVVKSPVVIVDELLALNPEFAQELEKFRAESGFDLRNDFAAPLGGEVAVGVDGPLLPEPSWKLVTEVYDPAHLQQTFERAVTRINDELRRNGKPGNLEILSEEAGGRTYYGIRSLDPKIELHWVYEEGYMVAGPSRALLERAIQQRDSGLTLASNPKFRGLLGPDGQVNVSALVYQNLAPLAQSASKFLPKSQGGPDSGPARLGKILAAQGPTLYYAYAEPDRIVFAGSNQNPLGLNLGTLAGFGGMIGGMNQAYDEALQGETR